MKAIAPYPEADGAVPLAKINIERNWSVKYGGLSWGRDSYDYYYNASELSPDYTDADLEAIDKGSELSLGQTAEGVQPRSISRTSPISDARSSSSTAVTTKRYRQSVTADWFAHVHAPLKKLVWFENSAHMMQIEEPGQVLVHLVEDVRPLADSTISK